MPAFLDTARALTQAAAEALGGLPGTRPLVVDPFAGGGAIPLEALRVGADAFASDLNPVAVLLNKVVLEYIPKYGQRLADEVRRWGQWIKEQAEQELAQFYPPDPDGATPFAYLWARKVICEAPDDGSGVPVEVPLMRSLWLAKKTGRNVALRWRRDDKGRVQTETVTVTYANGESRPVRRPLLEIFEPKKAAEVEEGTMARGSATCPVTGYTTPVASVRRQLKARRGGASDARLFAVVTTRPAQPGRFYRLPVERDWAAARAAAEELERRKVAHTGPLSLVPDEILPVMSGVFNAPIYGHDTWGSLYGPRQSLALITISRLIQDIGYNPGFVTDANLLPALLTLMAFALDKQADLGNSLNRWEPVAQCPRQLFGRQAIPMIWDFAEGVPIGSSSGAFEVFINGLSSALDKIGNAWLSGHVEAASATSHPLPDDLAQCFFTDPPYYNAVPSADLSDFFYVWFKRTIGTLHSDLFQTILAPKDEECCEMAGWDSVRYPHKNGKWFEDQMGKALVEGRRLLTPNGIGLIVFAHKSTSGWEAQLQPMVEAGWVRTCYWPSATENSTRLRAQDSAALASSVHLVCRPRENPDGSVNTTAIGDWREVLRQLPERIHDWLPRLAREGVVGADAIFACLGPALEIYSRYSRVEKASGEVVALGEYLEYVWAAVSKEALGMVFAGADASGFEEDARLTAMWLWTLSTAPVSPGSAEAYLDEADDEDTPAPKKLSGGYLLEYDAARKIAQGLGAHLETLAHLVQVKGSDARLLPVTERANYLFGKEGVEGAGSGPRKRSPQLSFTDLGGSPETGSPAPDWGELTATSLGQTTLDRVHQSMLLFAAGRSEALKRFLVDDGVGRDSRYWALANALSALYPPATDEKRWVDGVLARKKGLGF